MRSRLSCTLALLTISSIAFGKCTVKLNPLDLGEKRYARSEHFTEGIYDLNTTYVTAAKTILEAKEYRLDDQISTQDEDLESFSLSVVVKRSTSNSTKSKNQPFISGRVYVSFVHDTLKSLELQETIYLDLVDTQRLIKSVNSTESKIRNKRYKSVSSYLKGTEKNKKRLSRLKQEYNVKESANHHAILTSSLAIIRELPSCDKILN